MSSKNVCFLVLLSLVCQLNYAQYNKTNDKPNVILIMADDMGYGDLGIHGNTDIQTPVLDHLAKESVTFSNFYVSPVCAPTRASLMTGRYHTRTGVYDTYSGGAIMASNEVTIAEIFRDNGYNTGIFGKWHLGDSYPSRPQDQGFTHSVWHLSGGIGQVGDVFNYYEGDRSYFDPLLYKNGEKFQSKGYCSDVFTNEAIEFIKGRKNEPFLAYLSFNAPHTPLQVPDSYYNMYKDATISPDKYRDQGYYTHDMSEHDIESAKRVYGMVSNIDDNIGKLIAMLKKEGIYDNTVIVFLTDNGPQQYRYLGGYRGKKGLVREGGIHVPFYMKMPKGKFKKKSMTTAAAHIDVLPTLATLCELSLPEGLKLDGVSFASSITKGIPLKSRPLFFEWQRSFPEKYRNMTVLLDNHKLIANAASDATIDAFELYDLTDDPYEASDISSTNPTIVRQLKNKLDSWHDDIINSENILQLPRIIVGSDKEPHTILNRNDARGMQLIWDDERIHVSWDLTVEEDGVFDIICHFRNPIPNSGDLVLRFGVQNITKTIEEKNTQHITLNNIALKKGATTLDGWFLCSWKEYYTPFYIELIRKN